MSDFITTKSGKEFQVLRPKPEMICIEDIGHALSNLCRFTGHSREFYSVAEHCIRVSYDVPKHLALKALLHDATEAYTNDISSPLKQYLLFQNTKTVEQFQWLESDIELEIFEALKVEPISSQEHDIIKESDLRLFCSEFRDLMPEPYSQKLIDMSQKYGTVDYTILPSPPGEAKDRFLSRYAQLKTDCKCIHYVGNRYINIDTWFKGEGWYYSDKSEQIRGGPFKSMEIAYDCFEEYVRCFLQEKPS